MQVELSTSCMDYVCYVCTKPLMSLRNQMSWRMQFLQVHHQEITQLLMTNLLLKKPTLNSSQQLRKHPRSRSASCRAVQLLNMCRSSWHTCIVCAALQLLQSSTFNIVGNRTEHPSVDRVLVLTVACWPFSAQLGCREMGRNLDRTVHCNQLFVLQSHYCRVCHSLTDTLLVWLRWLQAKTWPTTGRYSVTNL